MRKSTLLLQENPPFILAPGIELPQNVIVNTEKKYSKKGPLKCDGCGKALTTPYYVSFGIPPCSLIIETYKILADSDIEFKQLACETQSRGILSRDDLIRLTSENDEEFKRLVSEIQSVAKRFDIDSKYQWIFSEQNIKNSKTRICSDCQKECKWRLWRGFEIPTIHIQEVCFAVKEYQRRHTPIDLVKSDYERYIISLPDRTNLAQQHFGDVDLNENFELVEYERATRDYLSMALIPDYKGELTQEFRTKFIEQFLSKNKAPLNEQELTKCMKTCLNDDNDNYWFRIQYCKVFLNPKTVQIPIFDHDGEMRYTTKYTKYTVVVHYSIPNGEWNKFDI